MTPTERANKIDELYFDSSISTHEEKIRLIASQFSEAEREAVLNKHDYISMKDHLNRMAEHFDRGFSSARDKAAGIVNGEIQLYEEQSLKVSPNRQKKIQKRWVKLKEVLRRIRAMEAGK